MRSIHDIYTVIAGTTDLDVRHRGARLLQPQAHLTRFMGHHPVCIAAFASSDVAENDKAREDERWYRPELNYRKGREHEGWKAASAIIRSGLA